MVKEEGADMIGFVFADSKRKISVPKAAAICRSISGIAKVGVFVNQPVREVAEIAARCGLDYVQLHGNETKEYCSQVGLPIIKACQVNRRLNPVELNEYQVEMILVDSFLPGQPGGTGVTFDWQQVKEVLQKIRKPFLVAGGLTSMNVAEAIGVMKPAGVDVSGGVETAGRKDNEKIRKFITAARMVKEGELC